ncbi:hypothetical protein DM860_014135 [Cuscuta australis]|uniref:DOG1 domain-containing protein n=1 Tax=Cuscuta australis TaxID=267555 RepID=A0A328DHB6_9ASTE|nr:hypothetical protein DM860_014135 [Cuscuta australis]
MNSTYTEFVNPRQIGICDPIHEIGMWGGFNGSGCSSASATMILEVGKSMYSQMPVFETSLNQTEEALHGIAGPSNKYEGTSPKSTNKLLRRLAQNREAARKSRLRKKAYLHQLESSQLKLIKLEQELERERLLQGKKGTSHQVHTGTENSGITAFEKEYRDWIEEQNNQIDNLRNALHSEVDDTKLGILIDGCKSHYKNLFCKKATAAKADVFYIMSGLWKTPSERLFLWIGGVRPSEILKIVLRHVKPLTEDQLPFVTNLQLACHQMEEALSQGFVRQHQFLSEAIATGLLGEGNYLQPAMEHLGLLVNFIIQADNLRLMTIEMVSCKLTIKQAAWGLLALGEYLQRLRTLSSVWENHLNEPAE